MISFRLHENEWNTQTSKHLPRRYKIKGKFVIIKGYDDDATTNSLSHNTSLDNRDGVKLIKDKHDFV